MRRDQGGRLSPGTYSGEAAQKVTGRDGSKVFAWKALSLVVDAAGCIAWHGIAAGDILMPGDAARARKNILNVHQ